MSRLNKQTNLDNFLASNSVLGTLFSSDNSSFIQLWKVKFIQVKKKKAQFSRQVWFIWGQGKNPPSSVLVWQRDSSGEIQNMWGLGLGVSEKHTVALNILLLCCPDTDIDDYTFLPHWEYLSLGPVRFGSWLCWQTETQSTHETFTDVYDQVQTEICEWLRVNAYLSHDCNGCHSFSLGHSVFDQVVHVLIIQQADQVKGAKTGSTAQSQVTDYHRTGETAVKK